jgi:hypothetical protein
MEKTISVVSGVSFPLDAVTQKFAWLGRSGSGKSYGLKRFVEQLIGVGAQVVVVDTVGIHFGLRRGDKGLAIPVLGGLYGDIPLESTAGELVSEVVVSSGSSMVIDTSHFRDAERARFMEAFGRKLFELKKRSPSAMHVALDEGQDVVPQNPSNNENMMLHEWVRIAKQGRAFGIGLSISSQRPQELNKKALNQTECVLAFQLTGPQERKALEYWLADKGVDTKLSERLPTLEVGTPFVWSPQWLKVADVFGKVLPIDSDDTSQTPTLGAAAPARAQLKPIDLGKLRESMATAVEEHEQNDPLKLKETVKELQQQLAGKGASAAASKPGAGDAFAHQVLGHLQLLKTLRSRENVDFQTTMDGLRKLIDSLNTTVTSLVELAVQSKDPILEAADVVDVAAFKFLGSSRPADETVPAAAVPVAASTTENQTDAAPKNPMGLPKGELAVLRAVASYADGVHTTLISLVTGLKTRSIQNYLVALSQAGLVERGSGTAKCTAQGIKAAAPVPPRRTGRALVESCLKTLPVGEAKVLREVFEEWPRGIKNQKLAERTELSLRSVQNYLVNLSTRRLVTRSGGAASISKEVGL